VMGEKRAGISTTLSIRLSFILIEINAMFFVASASIPLSFMLQSKPFCMIIFSSFEQTISLCVARLSSTCSIFEQIASCCESRKFNVESATSTQSPMRATSRYRFSPGYEFTFAVNGLIINKKKIFNATVYIV